MKISLLILLLASTLLASTIKSHNIYVRDDRVDIMLSFDTPFDNPVQQQKGEDFVRVILIGVAIENEVNEKIDTPFVKQMNIIPYEAKTEVLLKIAKGVNIIASKTVDGFGLRLRVKGKIVEKDNKLSEIKSSVTKDIKVKEAVDYSRYYIVVGILLLLLIVLLVTKKVVEKNRLKTRTSPNSKEPNLNILYQKIVDDKNRLMLFEFEEVEYLVMVGSSNILLNKKELKKEPKIKTKQEEFEEMLKQKGVDLNNANIKIRN